MWEKIKEFREVLILTGAAVMVVAGAGYSYMQYVVRDLVGTTVTSSIDLTEYVTKSDLQLVQVEITALKQDVGENKEDNRALVGRLDAFVTELLRE